MIPLGLQLFLIAMTSMCLMARLLWLMFVTREEFIRASFAAKAALFAVFVAAWFLFINCTALAAVANRQ